MLQDIHQFARGILKVPLLTAASTFQWPGSLPVLIAYNFVGLVFLLAHGEGIWVMFRISSQVLFFLFFINFCL